MFALGLRGPLSPEVVRRFANDLGGALFGTFEETEQGNWIAPINNHFIDRAFSMANRHGLVVLGVRQRRVGAGAQSHRFALPEPSLQLLGKSVPSKQATEVAADSEGSTPEHDRPPPSELSTSASDAIERAASNAGGTVLNTLHLLLALHASDSNGQWERLWLEAGTPAYLGRLQVEDPEPEADVGWDGVLLTRTCKIALEVAASIARSYDLGLVPIGAVALGLVADPRSAAAMALTDHGMQYSSLVELLQEITLKTHLGGLAGLLREIRSAAADLFSRQSGVMPDGGGLRHHVVSASLREDSDSDELVLALCGRTWIPDPAESPSEIPCPECRKTFDSMSRHLEVDTHEFNWSPIMTSMVMPFQDGSVRLPY